MIGHILRIGDFEWRPECGSWVTAAGDAVPREKALELDRKADDIFQQQVMERLDGVRAAFHCMSGQQERAAAFEWLRKTYKL